MEYYQSDYLYVFGDHEGSKITYPAMKEFAFLAWSHSSTLAGHTLELIQQLLFFRNQFNARLPVHIHSISLTTTSSHLHASVGMTLNKPAVQAMAIPCRASILIALVHFLILMEPRRNAFAQSLQPSIFLNAGGPNVTDSAGNLWIADSVTEYYNTGIAWTNDSIAISGAETQELYQSERWGPDDSPNMTYDIPVLNGDYEVILHFAELYGEAMVEGGRVFNVTIEESTVLVDLDIFDQVGGSAALKKTKVVTVSDEALTITFQPFTGKESPKINAIEVHPKIVFTPIYINAGGDNYTDSQGNEWVSSSVAVYHNTGNQVTPSTSEINNTVDDTLYQTELWDDNSGEEMKFEIPVPTGTYEVTLHFAETYEAVQMVRARVFDVSIEESIVFTDLDIYAEVGPFAALTKTTTVNVTDGLLTIEFLHVPNSLLDPKICAIEVHLASEGRSVAPPTMDFTPIHINAGGGFNFTDDDTGVTWEQDAFFVGGSTYGLQDVNISDTTNDELYRSERFGTQFSYEIPVPDGNFRVTLHFAEVFQLGDGLREFDVFIENTLVLDTLDIYSEVGAFAAMTKEVPVTVTDGVISIEFVGKVENAKISGIEVSALGFVEAHRAHAVPGGPYFQTDTDGDGFEDIQVDGSFSHTHTQDQSIWSWRWFVDGEFKGEGETTTITLPVGEHNLTLEVYDTEGDESADSTNITVRPFGFPDIEMVLPNVGDVSGGYEITIVGSGFVASAAETTVRFGSSSFTDSEITIVDENTIVVKSVPPSPKDTVSVFVETSVGTSNFLPFVYYDPLLPPVEFTIGEVIGDIAQPTTLAFGPDGKLYVGTVRGELFKLTLNDQHQVVSQFKTDIVVEASPPYRAILGITFDPMDTSENPTVYASNCQLFHGKLVDYNGKVSAISGENLDTIIHVVTGVDISDHDHGMNGIEFGDNGELYIQNAGCTNAGVPGPLTGVPNEEQFLSSATLVAHMSREKYNGTITYNEQGDQLTGDVEVFAAGMRNPYDIVLHSNGYLYGTDNGPNNGFGKQSTGCQPEDVGPDPWQSDKLNLIQQGGFYGHANRKRGETDPRQCIWRPFDDTSDEYTPPIGRLWGSTDGLVEFQSDHFNGQLRGHLIAAQFKGSLFDIELTDDGLSTKAGPGTHAHTLKNENGSQPGGVDVEGGLDVTQGPDGTLFVAQVDTGKVIFIAPKEIPSATLKVNSIFPRRGPESGGSVLTLYGQNLDTFGSPLVSVGGKNCTVSLPTSESKISCTLPSGVGTADVVVSASEMTYTFARGYRYISGQE